MEDFWSGKIPCWTFLGCSELVYSNCAAYQHRERPCWELAETECRKLLNFEWRCNDCKVFLMYGHVPMNVGKSM